MTQRNKVSGSRTEYSVLNTQYSILGAKLPWPRSSPCHLIFLCLLAASGCLNHAVNPLKPADLGSSAPGVKIETRPIGPSSPVETRLLVIATVTDAKGPAKRQKIEWIVEGVGHILEVDPRGNLLTGRGTRTDGQNATSYTGATPRRVPLTTGSSVESISIEPGQTWCIVSSTVEGETRVTAYAPDLADKENNRAIATHRWIDLVWRIAPSHTERSGNQQVLTTSVFRHSDRQALTGGQVRYRVVDGPPAAFVPYQSSSATVPIDASGQASVSISQLTPGLGRNRVSVEVLGPGDQAVLAQGETIVDWEAGSVALAGSFSETVTMGQDAACTLTLSNNGPVGLRYLTVRTTIPDGLIYLRSNPPAHQEGVYLVWTLDGLAGRGQRSLEAVFRPVRTGQLVCLASVSTEDGQRDERSVPLQVLPSPRPQLKVEVTGDSNALLVHADNGDVAMPVREQVKVCNVGTETAPAVRLRVELEPGLTHDNGNPVEYDLGELTPGACKNIPLVVKPERAGPSLIRLSALIKGRVLGQAGQPVLVREAGLALKMTGPELRYVGQHAHWDLEVKNTGGLALAQVAISDALPAELDFVKATEGGRLQGREVVWTLSRIEPGEVKKVRLTARANRMAPKVVNQARVTGAALDNDPGPGKLVSATGGPLMGWNLDSRAAAAIALEGLPAFKMMVDGRGPIEVGERTTYTIDVTNTGSLPGSGVQIVGTVPALLRVLAAGPGPFRVDGPKVTFNPLPQLNPGQRVRYVIEVQAVQPGDARFHVELTSSILKQRVVKEHSLTISPHPDTPPAAPPLAP